MGLFKRIKDPIEGSATVVAASGAPDTGTVRGRCELHLVVQLPGEAPYPHELTCLARAKRWPYAGMVVPVTVDGTRRDRVEIDWDRVPDSADVARQRTQQLADQMGGAAVPGAGPGMVPGAIPPEAQQIIDQLGLGGAGGVGGPTVIVDGQVVSGAGATGVPPTAAPDPIGGDDRIAALERLVALRDQGVLSPEEFAAEKARVLGG